MDSRLIENSKATFHNPDRKIIDEQIYKKIAEGDEGDDDGITFEDNFEDYVENEDTFVNDVENEDDGENEDNIKVEDEKHAAIDDNDVNDFTEDNLENENENKDGLADNDLDDILLY